MKFRIFFTYEDDTQDELDIEAETIEELRVLAGREIEKRKPKLKDYYSMEVDE